MAARKIKVGDDLSGKTLVIITNDLSELIKAPNNRGILTSTGGRLETIQLAFASSCYIYLREPNVSTPITLGSYNTKTKVSTINYISYTLPNDFGTVTEIYASSTVQDFVYVEMPAPIFYNGTEVNNIIYNGQEVTHLNYNGTQIY